jgi:hypothetical protein
VRPERRDCSTTASSSALREDSRWRRRLSRSSAFFRISVCRRLDSTRCARCASSMACLARRASSLRAEASAVARSDSCLRTASRRCLLSSSRFSICPMACRPAARLVDGLETALDPCVSSRAYTLCGSRSGRSDLRAVDGRCRLPRVGVMAAVCKQVVCSTREPHAATFAVDACACVESCRSQNEGRSDHTRTTGRRRTSLSAARRFLTTYDSISVRTLSVCRRHVSDRERRSLAFARMSTSTPESSDASDCASSACETVRWG